MTTTTTIPTTGSLAADAQASLECLIAIETTVTRDCAVESDGVRIVAGPSRRLTLDASPRGLGAMLPGELTPRERELVDDELARFVTLNGRGPVVLGQLLDRGNGALVNLEIRLLPVDEQERADVAELLGYTKDPEAGHAMAEEYADEIEAAWAKRMPDGRLPVDWLEDYHPARIPGVTGAAQPAAA